MEFSEFLKALPEEKRGVYHEVYKASFTKEKNPALASRLDVSLNQIETARSDLMKKGFIKAKKKPYRQKLGLPPFQKSKTNSKKNQGFYRTAGLISGQTRHTFIIDEKNLENLRLLSHHDHKNISEFVNDLLTDYFSERKSDLDLASHHRAEAQLIKLKVKIE
jgi:hypothetical protein